MARKQTVLGRPLAAAALAAALLAGARPASAQLPSASAAALGMGDNYTAIARGRNAAAWNPAGLGMPGNPGMTFSLLPMRGHAGIGPITLQDFKEYEGVEVPHATREEWLRRIVEQGGEEGAFGADLTYLSLNVGRIGIQLSSQATSLVNLAPDAAELLLFGNAGREGTPRDFALKGSRFDVALTSTVAVSYAQPLRLSIGPLPDQSFSVGATVKYTVGNGIVSGRDAGSTLTSDPLAIDIAFPIIHSDTAAEGVLDNGSGFGLDVGAAWQGGPFAAGVVVRNLVNTFQWDEARLFYRAGSAAFGGDGAGENETDFDMHPIAEAPEAVRQRAAGVVEEMRFEPTLAVGASMRVLPRLLVAADVRRQLGEGMHVGPATHIGVGAEFRPLGFLPLRAGMTKISGGVQWSGGLGLEIGRFLNLGVSAARRTGDLGDDTMAAFSLSFGGN